MIHLNGLYPAKTGIVYNNATLHIEFHGTPLGKLAIDVKVINNENQCVGYMNFFILREELIYNNDIVDPYDRIIDAIQKNILNELIKENPYNCTFTLT